MEKWVFFLVGGLGEMLEFNLRACGPSRPRFSLDQAVSSVTAGMASVLLAWHSDWNTVRA